MHENIVCNSTVLIAYSSLSHTVELVGTCTVGMSGMRKFPYRYTGKNIPVIPVYRYFGLVKS